MSGTYYWCLEHARVAYGPIRRSLAQPASGSTREEAEGAIQRAHERSAAWDREDAAWRNPPRHHD